MSQRSRSGAGWVLFGFAFVTLFASGSPSLAQDSPDTLVKSVTLEVIDLISKDKEIQSGNQKKVVALVEAKVLPHFNFVAMTRLAVATNWEKATGEQKKQLTEEFKT